MSSAKLTFCDLGDGVDVIVLVGVLEVGLEVGLSGSEADFLFPN
jgi:hypothetical protein